MPGRTSGPSWPSLRTSALTANSAPRATRALPARLQGRRPPGVRTSHPDLLARNPLLRTRLARDRAGDEDAGRGDAGGAGALRRCEALREHPRDDKLWRAVERTYVRPAATQERAAAALGLPFSTYRRHLTQGVDRVVAWLWDQEVYGEHH